MEDKQNRCSLTPLICSIVPIVFAAVLIGFVGLVSPRCLRPSKDCFVNIGTVRFLVCVGFPIAIVTWTLGIASIVLGITALGKSTAKDKKLAMVAIGLSILEIATVSVVLGLALKLL